MAMIAAALLLAVIGPALAAPGIPWSETSCLSSASTIPVSVLTPSTTSCRTVAYSTAITYPATIPTSTVQVSLVTSKSSTTTSLVGSYGSSSVSPVTSPSSAATVTTTTVAATSAIPASSSTTAPSTLSATSSTSVTWRGASYSYSVPASAGTSSTTLLPILPTSHAPPTSAATPPCPSSGAYRGSTFSTAPAETSPPEYGNSSAPAETATSSEASAVGSASTTPVPSYSASTSATIVSPVRTLTRPTTSATSTFAGAANAQHGDIGSAAALLMFVAALI